MNTHIQEEYGEAICLMDGMIVVEEMATVVLVLVLLWKQTV